MSSAELEGDTADLPRPQTPQRSKDQSAATSEPPSRALKGEGSAKRVYIRDEAYSGSPTKSGRKKAFLSVPSVAESSNIRTASGLHGLAPPAAPRIVQGDEENDDEKPRDTALEDVD